MEEIEDEVTQSEISEAKTNRYNSRHKNRATSKQAK